MVFDAPRWSPDGETISIVRWSCYGCEANLVGSEGYDAASGELVWTSPYIQHSQSSDVFFTDDNGLWLNPLDPQRVIHAPNRSFRVLRGSDSAIAAISSFNYNVPLALSIRHAASQPRRSGHHSLA